MDEEGGGEGRVGHRKKPKCRYGDDCRLKGNATHAQRFWHPGEDETVARKVSDPEKAKTRPDDVSQEGDDHVGTKFPRMQCKNHPGCKNRWTCWYSHGLIHSAVTDIEAGTATCFLSHPPHNQGCMNLTWSGDPFDFCSKECREMAKLTPKGPLGCRRENCPCPVTVNGMAGQFCCKSCYEGKSCRFPTHVVPTAHLVVVAKPQVGKYAPCAREGCACAVEGGSSWNGKPGQYCCRACRNGTHCTKLWHTEPDSERAKSAAAYVGFTCAMDGCDNPPWNGVEGEYCCLDHRHMAMGNYIPVDEEFVDTQDDAQTLGKRLLDDVAREMPTKIPFPNYAEMWRHAASWAKNQSGWASKGKIVKMWFNESLACKSCPSRIQFEKAVKKSGCKEFRQGEFGWHGTKSIEAVNGICWSNLDTARRSGQAFGPGEYFSRGTQAGLNYSEGYAGGTAGNLLMIFWIISSSLGAAPKDPSVNGAGIARTDGHIVVNNPVTGENQSTGVMYCVPCGVVAFGSVTTPNLRTFNSTMNDQDIAALLDKFHGLTTEARAIEGDKVFYQAQELITHLNDRVLKIAIESNDVALLQTAIERVQRYSEVDRGMLEKARNMIGPVCNEQLKNGIEGSDANALQSAIATAEGLISLVDKSLLDRARKRLPQLKYNSQLRAALDMDDMAAIINAVSHCAGAENLDAELFDRACHTLIEKCSAQLQSGIDGDDVTTLQKAISQAENVQDAFPKEFDAEESNWVPTFGAAKIDEELLNRARARVVSMKHENGLRIVIQQVELDAAPVSRLFHTLSMCKDIEGIDASLLEHANKLAKTKCESTMQKASNAKDLETMMLALAMSAAIEDLPAHIEDLVIRIKEALLGKCDEKRHACEKQLTDACDGISAEAVQDAITNAMSLVDTLKTVAKTCTIPLDLHEELTERLTVDPEAIASAKNRHLIMVFEEGVMILIQRLQQESVHISCIKLWIDQAAAIPSLKDVKPELLQKALSVLKMNCEKKLRAASEGDDIVALLTAITWSDGIDGVDQQLVESAQQLAMNKCEKLEADLQEQLQAAIAGFDVSMLEQAIAQAESIHLPSDPFLGFGPRLDVSAADLAKAILGAQSPKDAIPKAWEGNDSKLRIARTLLNEARKRATPKESLLKKARARLVVVQGEAALRSACDDGSVDALVSGIAKAEAIKGINADLLAQTKDTLVKNVDTLLKNSCEERDVSKIKDSLTTARKIAGMPSSSLQTAQDVLIETCNSLLKDALAGDSQDALKDAYRQVDGVEGLDDELVTQAQDKLCNPPKACCCSMM